jgi:hypothetical protein
MSKNNRRFKMGDIDNHNKSDDPIDLGDQITLTPDEKADVNKIHDVLAAKKNLIYELTMQKHKLESDLNLSLSEAKNIQTELFNKAAEIARAKGIDVDDPTKGKWNLDINKMIFIKMS